MKFEMNIETITNGVSGCSKSLTSFFKQCFKQKKVTYENHELEKRLAALRYQKAEEEKLLETISQANEAVMIQNESIKANIMMLKKENMVLAHNLSAHSSFFHEKKPYPDNQPSEVEIALQETIQFLESLPCDSAMTVSEIEQNTNKLVAANENLQRGLAVLLDDNDNNQDFKQSAIKRLTPNESGKRFSC